MQKLLMFFASGDAFFVGLVLALLAVGLALAPLRKTLLALRALLMLGAAALIALSATPLPPGFYSLVALLAIIWLPSEIFFYDRRRWILPMRLSLVGMCAVLAGLELPHRFVPTLPPGPYERLYVIGDSISSGLGTSGVTPWPQLLRQQRGIDLVDLAVAGATLGSAYDLLEDVELGDGLILLEIGGNDLLGRLPADQFEQRLDRLLQRVKGSGRSIVMFELPLMPAQNGIGAAQRRLARRHGVALVPKRIVAEILSADDGTLDGLHLSKSGHEAMADAAWAIMGETLLALGGGSH